MQHLACKTFALYQAKVQLNCAANGYNTSVISAERDGLAVGHNYKLCALWQRVDLDIWIELRK